MFNFYKQKNEDAVDKVRKMNKMEKIKSMKAFKNRQFEVNDDLPDDIDENVQSCRLYKKGEG